MVASGTGGDLGSFRGATFDSPFNAVISAPLPSSLTALTAALTSALTAALTALKFGTPANHNILTNNICLFWFNAILFPAANHFNHAINLHLQFQNLSSLSISSMSSSLISPNSPPTDPLSSIKKSKNPTNNGNVWPSGLVANWTGSANGARLVAGDQSAITGGHDGFDSAPVSMLARGTSEPNLQMGEVAGYEWDTDFQGFGDLSGVVEFGALGGVINSLGTMDSPGSRNLAGRAVNVENLSRQSSRSFGPDSRRPSDENVPIHFVRTPTPAPFSTNPSSRLSNDCDRMTMQVDDVNGTSLDWRAITGNRYPRLLQKENTTNTRDTSASSLSSNDSTTLSTPWYSRSSDSLVSESGIQTQQGKCLLFSVVHTFTATTLVSEEAATRVRVPIVMQSGRTTSSVSFRSVFRGVVTKPASSLFFRAM